MCDKAPTTTEAATKRDQETQTSAYFWDLLPKVPKHLQGYRSKYQPPPGPPEDPNARRWPVMAKRAMDARDMLEAKDLRARKLTGRIDWGAMELN